jgi:uncharacterized damage-inducible protein DinB
MAGPIAPLHDAILATWHIHQRATDHFLAHLPAGALAALRPNGKGRSVAQQLVHLHSVRLRRLKAFARQQAIGLSPLAPEAPPATIEAFRDHFQQTGEAMGAYIQHCLEVHEGACPNFKRGVVPMMGYYISHESHHRGHILLTLRAAGLSPSEQLRMHVWDWNKL